MRVWQGAGVDWSLVTGVNTLLTILAAAIVAVLTIAHNRKISREALEATRREWADVAERRLELNQSLVEQVQGLKAKVGEMATELGEVRSQNEFLKRRNVELQQEVDRMADENWVLRNDLRRAGIDVTPRGSRPFRRREDEEE